MVLVAYPDQLLDETSAELTARFPGVSFKKVGADLGRPGYLDPILKAIDGIDVQINFLNAGYVVTGFFADV